MKTFNSYIHLAGLFIAFLISGCATSGTGTGSSDMVIHGSNTDSYSNVSSTNITMDEYLQRLPGVQVSGNAVIINGVNNLGGYHPPLFVVDGVRVGRNYRAISGMDGNMINKVEVVKGASASAYGFQGAHGIIAIYTKKN